jgi:putative nucleotidyltransferase with HDIG domain
MNRAPGNARMPRAKRHAGAAARHGSWDGRRAARAVGMRFEMQGGVSPRSRGQSAPALPRPRTELRRLRAQVARLDHLTRVQALALARIAELPLAAAPEAPAADARLANALLEMLDVKDRSTRAHCERVSRHAVELAAELGCTAQSIERVRLAALLHDVGKLGVPDRVLGKPGPLSAREWSAMRRHPELGARMLEPLASLADVALYVRHHHEWYDGSPAGYPDRLEKEQIPLPSRIVAVADAFESMAERRVYRKPRPLVETLEELQGFRGRQFDPDVVDAVLRLAERRLEERARKPLRALGRGE